MLISKLLAIVSKPLPFNRKLFIQYKLGLSCAYYTGEQNKESVGYTYSILPEDLYEPLVKSVPGRLPGQPGPISGYLWSLCQCVNNFKSHSPTDI